MQNNLISICAKDTVFGLTELKRHRSVSVTKNNKKLLVKERITIM